MCSRDIGDENGIYLKDPLTFLQEILFLTMAAKFGHIKEFSPDSDSIKSYLERVMLYFDANSVPQAKQVPILLSSIGPPTYSLLSDLLAPDSPSTLF